MSHIFISYARENTDFAHRLVDELRQQGFDIWVDWQDIVGGEEWVLRLQSGIAEADVMLAIISPNFNSSKYCLRDLLYAEAKGIPIIPIMLYGDEVPYLLIDQQYINMQDYYFESGFETLIRRLKDVIIQEKISIDNGQSPVDYGIDFIYNSLPKNTLNTFLQGTHKHLNILQPTFEFVEIFEKHFVRFFSASSKIPKMRFLVTNPVSRSQDHQGIVEKLIRLSELPYIGSKLEIRLLDEVKTTTSYESDEKTIFAHQYEHLTSNSIPYTQIHNEKSPFYKVISAQFSHLWETGTDYDNIKGLRVFILQQRKDEDFARSIVHELNQQGYIAKSDIDIELNSENSDPWSSIAQEIQNSDAIVIVIGTKTLKSEWIQREIEYANSINKPIIPVYRQDFEALSQKSTGWMENLFSGQGIRVVTDAFLNLLAEEISKVIQEQYLGLKPLLLGQPVLETGEVKPANHNVDFDTDIVGKNQPISDSGSQDIDVFISYSRKNSDAMTDLTNNLVNEQFAVWTDEQIPTGSEAWYINIQNSLERARCIVVLLSPTAKDSKYVNLEIKYAQTHNKPIFAVLVLGDDKTSVPYLVSGAQRINFRSKYDEAYTGIKEYENELTNLIEAINEMKSESSTDSD